MEDWLEEASHRDEDAMTLMKYAKIDDAKIKVFILILILVAIKHIRLRSFKNLPHGADINSFAAFS